MEHFVFKQIHQYKPTTPQHLYLYFHFKSSWQCVQWNRKVAFWTHAVCVHLTRWYRTYFTTCGLWLPYTVTAQCINVKCNFTCLFTMLYLYLQLFRMYSVMLLSLYLVLWQLTCFKGLTTISKIIYTYLWVNT